MNGSKALTRSRYDKIIGGVAGGLAEYFHIDSAIVRVLFVLFTLLYGIGFWVYIILWIILPYGPLPQTWQQTNPPSGTVHPTSSPSSEENTSSNPMPQNQKKSKHDTNLIIGLILIVLGILFLISQYIPYIHFGHLWPFILIIIGIVLLYNYYHPKQKKSSDDVIDKPNDFNKPTEEL